MAPEPNIVLLGGEGIGPEVVEATADVLQHVLPGVRFSRPPHGEAAIEAYGTSMPDVTRQACREADAVLYGATWKHCKEVLRFLRFGLETFANVRPAKRRPGVRSPLRDAPPVDVVVVRENLEGEYPSREGSLEDFRAHWPEFTDVIGNKPVGDGAFALRITTEAGSQRISEYAAKAAIARRAAGRPGKVAIVTKQNVLPRTDGLFRAVAERVLDGQGVPHEHYYVDDACRRLVVKPEAFDVILAPNLFGDILSDITAELIGGLGLAPSGCIGHRYAYFEAVHGSAPDIAGKGIANPLATVLSAAMMLEHLGLNHEASALECAVDRVLEAGDVLTPDLGGSAGTGQVVSAVIRHLG
jgi:isocitrate/isopropylmalate dehydrogenase